MAQLRTGPEANRVFEGVTAPPYPKPAPALRFVAPATRDRGHGLLVSVTLLSSSPLAESAGLNLNHAAAPATTDSAHRDVGMVPTGQASSPE